MEENRQGYHEVWRKYGWQRIREKEKGEEEGRGGERNICMPLCRGGSVAFSAGYELR
jgi:hypothetical protein